MKKRFLLICLMALLSLAFAVPTLGAPTGEEFVNRVPMGAYVMGETVTYDNLKPVDLLLTDGKILEDALFALGDLENKTPPFSNNISSDPALERVSADRVKEVYESLFGPDSFSKIGNAKSIWGRFGILEYVEGKDEYAFIEMVGGGDPACNIRLEVISAESSGSDYIVKVRFGLLRYTEKTDLLGDTGFYTSTESVPLAYLGTSAEDDFDDGAYDEYLPVYTHTFKPNGDGGYYWYSTQMTEAPKKIPENMVWGYPEVEPLPTDTSSTESTGSTTDTSAADLLQTTSGTASDLLAMGGAEESNSLALWVAGGALVALCAVALVIFLKKK